MLERLKAFSPYAWMPVLIVGVISATLAYRNPSLQQAGNGPDMTFKRIEFGDPYGAAILSLGMQNVGTRAAFDYVINIKTVEVDSGRVAFLDADTDSKRQEEFGANAPVGMGKLLDALALCKTFHDDDGEQFSDPMFDPNADVCCLILAELSDHRGKILRVVCHKPSSRWRSASRGGWTLIAANKETSRDNSNRRFESI
jgi:hypothetical protein